MLKRITSYVYYYGTVCRLHMIFELERVSTNLQCDGDGLALVKVNIQKIQHCARTEWEAVRRRWYRSGSGSVTTIGDTVWNSPVSGPNTYILSISCIFLLFSVRFHWILFTGYTSTNHH